MKKFRRPLVVEQLEDRLTPSTFAMPWINPNQITLSFVPDGTTASSGVASNLFTAMNTQFPGQNWQLEVLRAFQTWAVNANVNIGLVADGGQAMGSPGLPQGDSRFGDIRIGGQALDSVFGLGWGFSPIGSTWAGDVLLNTNVNWGLGNFDKTDLFSVALHEAGHSFGFGDQSTDSSSALYYSYSDVLALNASDVAAMTSMYGPRQPDSYEGGHGNNTPQNAANLDNNHLAIRADISTLNEVDYYKVHFDDNLKALGNGGLTIHVHTAGISLLVPSLSVYDQHLNLVASAAATSPFSPDLTIQVPNPQTGQDYFIEVGNATQSVFGIGSYQLTINSPVSSSSGGSSTGFINPDNGHYGRLDQAMSLDKPTTVTGSQANARVRFSYQASIGSASDTQFYKVHSPNRQNNVPQDMMVMTWALSIDGLYPSVSVYDEHKNPVPSQVISDSNGSFSIDIPNALAGKDYFVQVSNTDASDSAHNTGNYFLNIDFSPGQQVSLQSLTSGTLSQSSPMTYQGLTLQQPVAFQFVLNADVTGNTAATEVQMAIYDQYGNLVFTLVARAGWRAASDVAYLDAGAYTIRYAGVTRDGSALGTLNFTLAGASLTDPQGPTLASSTTTTSPPPPTWTGPSTTATGTAPSGGTIAYK
jgi:hypothetical protein